MPLGISTSVVRRQLGRRLRALRESAGKTTTDVAYARIAARNKLWKIEHGRMEVRPGDVLALARLYGADAATTDELVRLAEATVFTNFQEDRIGRSVPEWVGMYSDLEAGAARLFHFNPELLHGLLQTEAYARGVITSEPTLSAEVIEQRVQFRLRRQRAFFDRPDPGRLRVVVPAGVLNLVVGSPLVMEEQLAHLRVVDERDEVGVRVLPVTDGVHTAMSGPFTIMDFDHPDDPPVVYLETYIGSRYIERTEQVRLYREVWEIIWAQASPLKEYLR